ncbi:conserved exported hypothetical protein [Candidatus Sulfopaludibacter sp. SbA3]|nr:conserved exported hypothetical protein [Candidatus Sulfopaludibacter sp. SbA3]
MIFRLPLLLLILAALLAPRAASAGQPAPAEPRYDPGATVEFDGIVTETREVPRSSPMRGLHLTVDTGRESLDVYLAPMEFMKGFDFSFAKGDRINVTGSKVKFNGGAVVLAKEVRRQGQTVYLRDASGSPYWPPGS